MKRLTCSLIFLLLFLLPPPAQALETYKEGPVVFLDDFNDGNFTGWRIDSGSWVIDSKKGLTGIQNGRFLYGQISREGLWTGFRLEVSLKNESGIEEGIIFRKADANNFYQLKLRHSLRDSGLYNTPEIILSKTERGILTKIASTRSIYLASSKFYQVKIEAVGEHLQIWIDNSLAFDLDDGGTTIKSGSIALSYWTGEYGLALSRFDDIKITSLTETSGILPVIFIPGLGGSELQSTQDIFWSKSDGHGGIYSHAYSAGEKIWVNKDEAVKPGDDDYFDVLRLQPDGKTAAAELSLTGELTPFGYANIDHFFQSMGYIRGEKFFVFTYDWRKDISETAAGLDLLVETAKQKSGQYQVNIVAHSLGGLLARQYISDPTQSLKVNKLVELGVPHLGAVTGLKTLLYGTPLGKNVLGIFYVGISSPEVKDISSNFLSMYQLLPTKAYFNFYDNSAPDIPYPFNDERNIDGDKIGGPLSYDKTKLLLGNLNYNTRLIGLAEQFHNLFDANLNQNSGVKIYNIVGSGQPTLGQIKETWLLTWPVKAINKTDEIFINGDGTVPLYSASLKSNLLDLSQGTQLYFVEQLHEDLVDKDGAAMQKVKQILQEDNTQLAMVHGQKISLDGQQLSVHDAEVDLYDDAGNHTGLNSQGAIETDIPNTFYDSAGSSTHIFIKKRAPKIKAKIRPKKSGKTAVKLRHYQEDKISKASVYNNLSLTPATQVEIELNPQSTASPPLKLDNQLIPPADEEATSAAQPATASASLEPITEASASGEIFPDNTASNTAETASDSAQLEANQAPEASSSALTDSLSINHQSSTIRQLADHQPSTTSATPTASSASTVQLPPSDSQTATASPASPSSSSTADTSNSASLGNQPNPSKNTNLPADSNYHTSTTPTSDNNASSSPSPSPETRSPATHTTQPHQSPLVLGLSKQKDPLSVAQSQKPAQLPVQTTNRLKTDSRLQNILILSTVLGGILFLTLISTLLKPPPR